MAKNNIYQLFVELAGQSGDAPAFFTSEGSVSFSSFLGQVEGAAAGLQAKGVEKGDRVCILGQNSPEFMALIVGCAKLGAIAYPINWRLSPAEMIAVIQLAEPKVLAAGPEFSGPLQEAGASFTGISELIVEGSSQDAGASAGDPLLVISTAATEGLPRGAVLTHGNILAGNAVISEVLEMSAEDRFLAILPYFHIAGLGFSMAALSNGGAVVVLPGFDPAASAQAIDTYKVSLVGTFPPMLEMLVGARQQTGASWDSLRKVFGILNPPDVIQSYLALGKGEYWTGFGQAETTGLVTMINVIEKPGSAGKVVPGMELHIVDEHDQDVPAGTVGEIAARGPLVFAGFWRDEEASAYYGRNNLHHTGDLGKVDEDGYLYYAGRKPEREMIKSGGENVYPAEVEAALQALPQVAAVCVIGVADEKWGETVKAVVELAEGQSLDEAGLLAGIKDSLASYKKPRLVEFVSALPRTGGGEIDRMAVKAKFGG
ncbi:MAG: AMP-binding protein [Anaerolineae bacterium]|nr:AMP-binding protein [Anaerolineae bacterium]